MKHLRINKRKKKLIIGSVIALAILATVIGYTMISTESHTQEDRTNSISTVSVKELLASNKENISYLTGKVVPNEISKINADSTKGIINEVFVKVGDQVKKGQKLFTYNNPDGQIDLDDADTNIAKCQNKINSLNESIASKTQELSKKQVELAEENNKINNANKIEKEMLRQEKKVLEETIDTIQTDIQTSNSELNDANLDLNKAIKNQQVLQGKHGQQEVFSDVDGIVQKIDKTKIQTSNSSNGSTESFMDIMDTSVLKAQGNVDEFSKDKLSVGQPVVIIDRKNQEKRWKGKINKIDSVALDDKEDSTVSKYPFEVTIDNKNDLPTIGSHVYIEPKTNQSSKMMIPSSFVTTNKEKSFVWKAKDGKAVKQEVIVGKLDQENGKVEIKSGITEKDKLLVPNPQIKEGIQVDKI